ncbi:uncharacterized protein N7446_011597 [Penicillium canescens]|uniref:uncharacterized protein n=1 Tax=Penicillium canescens TaxID=5083 RepID=UPI0026E053A4|nr:uncharacterized protein N7446_011597 [Penicillium canescens]KAJ6048914.1 hypothetical protein N7446_011597 [Penicillium canescens]
MSEEDKNSTPSKPLAALNSPTSLRAESPTTARPLDFDDEPQESGVTTSSPAAAQPAPAEEAPPKPPRPLSPREQSEITLKEAFPSVEPSVVKAILVASNWNVERAFNALLGMTDPKAQEEMAPPPKPPRPSQQATSTTQRQLDADEIGSEESDDREYNFFDDDLPVIRENIRKGFLDTQSKVNSWVTNLKKRIDGEEVDQQSGPSQGESAAYSRPRRSGDMGRRSGDRERYDADPQVLGDDFSALELRDGEAPPRQPPRPRSNIKSSSPSPDRRKVSFQDGPPTEIDTLYNAPSSAKRNSSTGNKPSKWQPLSTVEPSPVAENDPFSLGDSDDEKDIKTKEQPTLSESDQIKKATAEAMSDEVGSSKDKDTKDASKPDETK